MKKGFKITAIVIGVILILMFLLPFAFRGKIEGIVKSEGNKMLNGHFDFSSLDISFYRWAAAETPHCPAFSPKLPSP